jgi:ferritin-like metal-binding protein YciE
MPQTRPKSPAKKTSQAKNTQTKSMPAKKSANSSNSSSSAAVEQQGNGVGGELLQKFLLDALKDIYWAEKHLTKAIPKMGKAATSDELKAALDKHLEVTEGHIERLERVFDKLGKKAQAKKCEAMEGLTKEADSIVEETEEGTSTRDVGIIMAAQKVEHYEIATYGGLVQLTKTMGLTDISELLAKTLAEEKEADETLTDIAENDINLQADEEGDGKSGA